MVWKGIADWAERTLTYIGYDGKESLIRLTPIQRQALDALVDHKIVVVCVPKRQGKTLISAVAAIYTAFVIDNSNTIILSTSKEHAASVAFRRVKELYYRSKTTLNTIVGVTRKQGIIRVGQNRIEITTTNSVIEAVPCVTEAIAGRTYTLLIIDELALIEDEEVASVAISQSERADARVLITSTASDTDHLLYRLYERRNEPHICFIYRSGYEFYQSNENNPLITDEFLRRQKELMIEPLFRQYFLNEFGGSAGRPDFVFKELDRCIVDRPPPLTPDDLKDYFPEMVAYGAFAGVDRALPFSRHGDFSAGVLVIKVLLSGNSIRYIVADAVLFETGEFDEIWRWINAVNNVWNLQGLALEQYQCYDLYDATKTVGIPATLVHVNPKNKQDAFNFLHALTYRNEIVIPSTFAELIRQLKCLRYKSGQFSAPSGDHDDLVYALVWAVYEAGRSEIYPVFFHFIP